MTMTPPSPAHTIEELCKRSHFISKEKGWVNEDGTDPRSFAAIIVLMHSELSEAMEDWRNNKKIDEKYYEPLPNEIVRTETTVTQPAKPCGIPIELADLVIRVAQYVGTAGDAAEFGSMCGDEASHYDGVFETYLAEAHVCLSMAYNDDADEMLTEEESKRSRLTWLAHAIDNTFAFCKKTGIDLWAAIDEKEAYNRTRPIRHGGKKV